MANVLVAESSLQAIADAIREKNGTQNTYTPGEMADAIEAISGGGGITPTGTINITQNGTTDVTNYASASVNVPNSYGASDEGKVVSSGALVAQTSETYTANNTYDTTLINEVTVNVPSSVGYTLADIGSVNAISGALTFSDHITRAYAFYGCTAITSVTLNDSANQDVTYVFYGCTGITSVVVNGTTTTLGDNYFQGCSNLSSFVAPELAHLSASVLRSTKVAVLVLPKLVSVWGYGLGGCTSLTSLDILGNGQFAANAFNGSTKLNKIIIRGSAVQTLSNTNAFTNTPFASGKAGGTLYVPQSMISSYQSDSNWSTIIGYANNNIQAIEGSAYETQYADGTTIPT